MFTAFHKKSFRAHLYWVKLNVEVHLRNFNQ